MKNVREVKNVNPTTNEETVEVHFEAEFISLGTNVLENSNGTKYRLGRFDLNGQPVTCAVYESTYTQPAFDKNIGTECTISAREGVVKGNKQMVFTLLGGANGANISIEDFAALISSTSAQTVEL